MSSEQYPEIEVSSFAPLLDTIVAAKMAETRALARGYVFTHRVIYKGKTIWRDERSIHPDEDGAILEVKGRGIFRIKLLKVEP